jgi:hypothetical protein
LFLPDHDQKVTCVSSCAEGVAAGLLAKRNKPVASGLVKQALLGSDPDPGGGRVVTYARWPRYTFISDTAPGTATGQALNPNGALWYVLSPSGQVIKTKP